MCTEWGFKQSFNKNLNISGTRSRNRWPTSSTSAASTCSTTTSGQPRTTWRTRSSGATGSAPLTSEPSSSSSSRSRCCSDTCRRKRCCRSKPCPWFDNMVDQWNAINRKRHYVNSSPTTRPLYLYSDNSFRNNSSPGSLIDQTRSLDCVTYPGWKGIVWLG